MRCSRRTLLGKRWGQLIKRHGNATTQDPSVPRSARSSGHRSPWRRRGCAREHAAGVRGRHPYGVSLPGDRRARHARRRRRGLPRRRLDRVTDRSGAIAELTVADVEAADAGYVFSSDGGRSSRTAAAEFGSPASRNCSSAGLRSASTSIRSPMPASRRWSTSSRGCTPGTACASARSPTVAFARSARAAVAGPAPRWVRVPLPWHASSPGQDACRVRAPTASRSHCAGTDPDRYARLPAGRAPGRSARPCLDRQRRAGDARPARPGSRRHHDRQASSPARAACEPRDLTTSRR